MINFIVILFLLMALAFNVLGLIGMFRSPDIYIRIHTTSLSGTTSVLSVFIAVIVGAELSPMSGKVMATMFFLLITAPVSSSLIGRYAWRSGIRPWMHGADCPGVSR